MSSYVYLMTCPERFKIGCSADPHTRRTALRCQTKLDLRLEAMVPGERTDEKRLLNMFAEHRIEGEWFYPTTRIRNWFLLHYDYIDPGIPYHPNTIPMRRWQLGERRGIQPSEPPDWWVRDQVKKHTGSAKRSKQ